MGNPAYGLGFHRGKKEGILIGVVVTGVAASAGFGIDYLLSRKSRKLNEQKMSDLEAQLKAEKAKNKGKDEGPEPLSLAAS